MSSFHSRPQSLCNKPSTSRFLEQVFLRNGFAARCEAMAMPRGQLAFNFPARPLVRALPLAVERVLVRGIVPADRPMVEGAQPEPGAKPKVKSASNRRGIANRLTSGG